MVKALPDLDISSLNVLIIEDNKYMQLILTEILRAFRVRNIRTAVDGADALDELKTFAADIVLCDWEMMPITGIEFTSMVRTMSDVANPYVSIILITGHTEAEKVRYARDQGVTEFLAKPVSAAKLYERICSVIMNPRQFIKTKKYNGPDRRRGSKLVTEARRRSNDTPAEDDSEQLSA